MESKEMRVAREAAVEAGAIIARYHREGIAMRSKDTANLVSDADIEAERTIVRAIRKACPRHAVLAEEEDHGGRSEASHLWIVDPLDGTNNFAHRIPHVAVSIAYYEEGRPRVGVVYNPLRDEWFLAEKGRGATFNGEPARVSDEASLEEIVFAVGFYYDRGAMMEATLAATGELIRRKTHGMRRFGTAALDLCMVGTGLFGAYFEYRLSPWDFAAGRLFVEEAGGRVTDCMGGPLPLGKSGVLATNSRVHDAVLEIVREHHPDLSNLP